MVSIPHVLLSLFFALWLLRIWYMDVNDGRARRREPSIRSRRKELYFLDKRSEPKIDLSRGTGAKWFVLEQVLNPTESQSVFAIPKQSAVTCLSECMLDLTLHGYCIVDPEMLKDRLGRWNVKRKFNQGVFHDEPFRVVKGMDYTYKVERTGAFTRMHQDNGGNSLTLWIPKFSSKHLVVMSSLTKKFVMNADNMAVFFWSGTCRSFDAAEHTKFPETWHAGFIDKNDADHATVDSSINCETWDIILQRKKKY